MSLPSWWPRTSCVYCGARIGCAFHLPFRLACVKHADLIALDPEYTRRQRD